MWYRALLVACIATACAPPETTDERAQGLHTARTVVSLTFDDTHADNFQVAAIAEERGMRATFYINSGRIGQSGWMTMSQLLGMQAAGHEIAGHTISHARLASIEPDEARREVCNDRVALLNAGFRVTSFAYPFSSQNELVQQIVDDCGYNSGRLVGGLVTGTSCNGCPYGNPRPPPDLYAIRTNASVKDDTTLDDLKGYVTQAENNGGGWVPLVFHHVCDNCDSLRVSPSTLAAFLDWLEPRQALGTYVGTVDEVIGGAVRPGVPGPPVNPPPPPTGNMLINPSLEADTNSDQIPDCWQRGGTGTNSATYTLTNNAYDGARAQRIDMTSFTSGARRIVSRQDTGTCAPAITPGRQYTMTARYIANTGPMFSVYYRNASGGWVWFAQSSRFATSSTYALASYTTPPMPADATGISVGLSIVGVGSLTMDAFTLVDAAGAETTPPTVSLTSPAAGATVSGTVQLSANASDASGIARVEFLINGVVVGTDTTAPYAVAWNSSGFQGQSVTYAARAVDTPGNTAITPNRTFNVAAAQDTTPPFVALTSPANGATVSGIITLSADATDAGGVARVEFFVNNALVATELTAPYELQFDTNPYAGTTITIFARAFDNANNVTTTASRQVTVAAPQDTTPPTVALTSPANGATVSGIVQLSADAADAGGIARVEFFVNNTLVATELTAPYELPFDTSPYAGTTITIVARAFDAAGNSTTSASHQVTVSGSPPTDTTPPTVAMTSPAAGATVSGIVTLAADAADASGIARVEFLVNGAVVGTDTSSPYSFSWDSSPFAGTTVTLAARAVDTATNAATSPTRNVTVAAPADTTPPTVAMTSPAAGTTVSGTVTLAANAADAGGVARVEFLVNGAIVGTDTTSPYSIAWNSSAFAGTTVTLSARAVDNANNVTTSATRQVTVASNAPPNLLQNASLEVDANGDQIPDCWQRGGSGTNAATYTLTTNASQGTRAQRIDMTSYSSGARRLVSRQDTGTCAPAVTAGRRYTVTARYIANTQPVFTVYYRNASGAWVWLAQSPAFATTSSYALATYTTPALPSGATHISVGLSIINLGSLTMDEFTLVAAP